MKTFLLLLAMASCTAAQQLPALQKGRQVLLDFRVVRNSVPDKLPRGAEKTVLSKVFRKYLTDESRCNPNFDASGSDVLEAARKAGQITPSIVDTASGSFTGPGKRETLYVIFVGECMASHADNFGTRRAAIFSGQQLVADVDLDFKENIERKTDLNSDGIDELLMTSGYTNQGTTTEMSVLLSFQNGRMNVVHDFGVVSEDSCASGFPGSESKASALYVSEVFPGKMPKLTQDNYASPCRRAKRWKHVSSGKIE